MLVKPAATYRPACLHNAQSMHFVCQCITIRQPSTNVESSPPGQAVVLLVNHKALFADVLLDLGLDQCGTMR